jgi:predicted RNA-binding Zn-ribbon protein involved in translation (DUF1610 family)
MTVPDPDALRRSEPCAECGSMMLWTQNAWASGDNRAAAYRCVNGHVVDPELTRECPECGVHDTRLQAASTNASNQHVCHRCGALFSTPR